MSDKAKGAPGGSTDSALAEVLKAITDDRLKALGNTRSLDGASFEATVTAYRQLARAADAIAETVASAGLAPKSVLVQDTDDVPDLAAHQAFLKSSAVLHSRLADDIAFAEEALGQPEPKLAIAAGLAGAAVSAGLTLLSAILHKDVSEKNFTISVDSHALITLVANRLRLRHVAVARPNDFALRFSDDGDTPKEGRLRERLEDVLKRGGRLRELLGHITQMLDPKSTAGNKDKLAAAKERLGGTEHVLTAFEDSLPAAAPQLFRGDEIAAFLADGGSVLSLQILAGGGSTRVETSTIGRDKVEHSGGVILGYTLFRTDGRVIASDIVVRHGRYEETSEHIEPWWDDDLKRDD